MPPRPAPVTDPAGASNLARQLYADAAGVFFWMQRLRPYICPFERLVAELQSVEEVLDVGCGAGLLLGLWACGGKARRGVGFDSSRPAIEAANRMRPRATQLGATADLAFLHITPGQPWPEGQFEAVSLIDTIHHVPPAVQRQFFQQVCSRVRPGGLLLYKDMSDRRFVPGAMNRMHDLVIAREWIHYVPLPQVVQWGSEEGLKRVKTESMTMLWYDHDMVIFRRG